MKIRTVVALAVMAFLAVLFAPNLLSVGATSRLDSAGALEAGHLWVAAGVVFAGGILTALTPCVFPLIPITVAIFSGRGGPAQAGGGAPRGRGRAAALTSCYVLGMAATFVALGIAAGLSGKAFGQALASPIIPLVLAFFFIALALSMFGAFEIALPPALALRLNQVGGAGFAGAFSMGLVAGLIAAPCTGPVLLGILAFVATHQSVALGSLLLFLYALGVGAPFFVIGVFSFNLGRSGPWMDAVKSVVGVVLLIMAVFEIRLSFPSFGFNLPAAPGIVFLIAGLVAAGVLLGAIHRSFHGSAVEKTLKTVGLALVILGFTARLDVENVALAQSPGGIPWVKDLDKALADAKVSHQPVFVDFYADWCAACKELDRKTYPDAKVRNEAKRFIAVKVDGTHESDALDKIYDRYKVEGLPTVIFIGSDGTLVKDQRVIGFVEPAEMVSLLKKVN